MGGLLLPRPTDTRAPTTVPASPSPAKEKKATPPPDLSPKVADRDPAADGEGSPVPEAAPVGLPQELAMSGLIPSLDAAAAAAPPDTGPGGATGRARGEEAIGDDGGTPGSAAPLIAGMVVSLAILVGGGGFLWWRNRDSRYWPA